MFFDVVYEAGLRRDLDSRRKAATSKSEWHSRVGWNDFVITLLREFLYVICFNIRCIIWCLAYIFNLRPLKAKLRIIEAFGTFWQFLAIFAFLAELDNSKHFEPYLFFGLSGLFWLCGLCGLQRPKFLAFSRTTVLWVEPIKKTNPP